MESPAQAIVLGAKGKRPLPALGAIAWDDTRSSEWAGARARLPQERACPTIAARTSARRKRTWVTPVTDVKPSAAPQSMATGAENRGVDDDLGLGARVALVVDPERVCCLMYEGPQLRIRREPSLDDDPPRLPYGADSAESAPPSAP